MKADPRKAIHLPHLGYSESRMVTHKGTEKGRAAITMASTGSWQKAATPGDAWLSAQYGQRKGTKMRHTSNKYLSLALVLILAAGCATMQSRWKDAESINTVTAYEDFLRWYPSGELADKARTKLEALYLQKAKDTNTIEAYEMFLKRYPQSKFANEARLSLENLKSQLKAVENAARSVLPSEAKVEVTSVSRYPQKPDLVISAHLLEGHSADDKSPYVRGDYGTHEKLTRLVRYRCAKVLKSIFMVTNLPDAGKINIEGRHGVRQSTIGIPFGGTDVAMTIYQISLPLEKARQYNWPKLEEDKIMELWSVDKNIIPSLQFITVPH
jgi:hypothetical protein